MSTNLSGNILTLNSTGLNEETLKAIGMFYIPDNCKAGDTVILDGIECLCVATGVTIQGSNLTRIAVDKNYDLGYYQKYIGITQNSIPTRFSSNYWRWGGSGTSLGNTSTEIGYGYQNTINCLSKKEIYTKGTWTGTSSDDGHPWLWLGVNDFRSTHSDKWFVPSVNETKSYIYDNIPNLVFNSKLGSSKKAYYWTSSESSADDAYGVSFNANGKISAGHKYFTGCIRMCRAF